MSEVVRWSLQDEKLLKCAASGKSANQIEIETGVPAAQAVVRIRELLRSQDIWTTEERKQLLLQDMYRLKDEFARHIDLSDAKHAEAMTKLLDQIGKRLDAASALNTDTLDKITTLQAQRLLQLYVLATERAKDILAEAYPEAILEDIDAALQEGLREAAGEIESP